MNFLVDDFTVEDEPVYCGTSSPLFGDAPVYRGSAPVVLDGKLGELTLPVLKTLTCFVSSKPHAQLFEQIKAILTAANVEFISKPERNEFSGVTSGDFGYCAFTMFLYRSENNKILVDFQKLSGSSRQFAQFQEHIEVEIQSSFAPRRKGIRAPPPLPFIPEYDPNAEESYLKLQLNLATSVDVNERHEGLAGLAALSSDSTQLTLLSSPQYFPSLLSLLTETFTHGDEQSVRSAALLVNSLAALPALRDQICQSLLSLIQQYLSRPSDDTFRSLVQNQGKQYLVSSLVKLNSDATRLICVQ
jgi:hypothetical protein